MEHYIRELLVLSIGFICSIMDRYVDRPGKDFTRTRKITAPDLVHFLLCKPIKTMRNEMQEWFRHSVAMPAESAMTQARRKLHSKAFYDLLIRFNLGLMGIPQLTASEEEIQILAVCRRAPREL